MGHLYGFTCAACGYAARVAGGDSQGELFAVRTLACATCGELVDAVVPAAGRPGRPLTCPKQRLRGPAHDVAPWTHPGRCPRCGGTIERGQIEVLFD